MLKKCLIVTLSIILFSSGFIVGKLTSQPEKNIVDARIKKTIVKKYSRSDRLISKKSASDTVSNKKNKIIRESDDIKKDQNKTVDSNDIDLYELQSRHDEHIENWNQEIYQFFIVELSLSDEIYNEYQELKTGFKNRANEYWKKIETKTQIGPSSYLFNTTYEDELELMNIKTTFHDRLRLLLGDTTYNKLQNKIKKYKADQVTRGKAGLYPGPSVNF